MVMDDAARGYIDAIPPASRPLFDRMHRLVLEAHPDAIVVLSYKMPTYVVGDRRLHVGVWKHGLSIYGWSVGRDAGFASRHPELDSGKGTLRLPHQAAAQIAMTSCGIWPGRRWRRDPSLGGCLGTAGWAVTVAAGPATMARWSSRVPSSGARRRVGAFRAASSIGRAADF